MFEWYKKVVFENYANFNGRARRSEFWYFALVNTIINIIFNLIMLEFPYFSFVQLAYSLAMFIPSLAVGVRRMHDVGKSGWYYIIPIYNLILACTDGDYGTNEYGEDPKNQIDSINEIGVE
ncbi:DUF805 domain-containing protein [Flavobacterium sp. FBOR7N2.3]|uniref:DUF805 domain-containing protein n=1 Tax=Flavobacterium magnesitis TaxID=3138077 RepID=A0ABV4TLF0_9FLAO